MNPQRIIIFGNVDAGRQTTTELIQKVIEERGITIDRPEVVFYNSSSDEDRQKIQELVRSNRNDIVIVGAPEKRLTEMEMLDSLFEKDKQIEPLIINCSKYSPDELACDMSALRKQSYYDRANPNQPFYAKFQKKPSKKKRE